MSIAGFVEEPASEDAVRQASETGRPPPAPTKALAVAQIGSFRVHWEGLALRKKLTGLPIFKFRKSLKLSKIQI